MKFILVIQEVCQLSLLQDNQSSVDALKSSKYVSDKRLRIEIGIVKEMVENKQIGKIRWIKSKKQIADILTKKGVSVNLMKAVLSECHLMDLR